MARVAYTDKEMVVQIANPQTDINRSFYGLSPIEQAIDLIASEINTITYNAGAFTENKLPRGMLLVDGDLDYEATEEMVDYVSDIMNGSPANQWRVPIIPSGGGKEGEQHAKNVQAYIDAVVAAGSTGAAMASSLFGLGRLHGIDRPAIAVTLPTLKRPIVLIDGGANSSCTPEMLYQFAVMGTIFSANVLGVRNPKIGVLNIGEEAGKGNDLAQKTYKLLEAQTRLNFIGNVEGKEIFSNICDVVVCDGFVGNVALKITEGSGSMLFKMLNEQFTKNIFTKFVGALTLPLMMDIYKKTNYEEYGGAILLGVKGITIISHGRSKAYAIKNAVRVAKEAVETGVNKKIAELIEKK